MYEVSSFSYTTNSFLSGIIIAIKVNLMDQYVFDKIGEKFKLGRHLSSSDQTQSHDINATVHLFTSLGEQFNTQPTRN